MIDDSNSIIVKYIMSDIYKNYNLPNRTKTCYMIRKGKNFGHSTFDAHPEDSILLDGMNDQKVTSLIVNLRMFLINVKLFIAMIRIRTIQPMRLC